MFYRFSYIGKGVFIGRIAYLDKFSLDEVSFMFEIHIGTNMYMFIDRYVYIDRQTPNKLNKTLTSVNIH